MRVVLHTHTHSNTRYTLILANDAFFFTNSIPKTIISYYVHKKL